MYYAKASAWMHSRPHGLEFITEFKIIIIVKLFYFQCSLFSTFYNYYIKNFFIFQLLAPRTGFEPVTDSLENWCSFR